MKCVECGETKQAVEMVISRSVIVCSECASPASPPAEPKCGRCGHRKDGALCNCATEPTECVWTENAFGHWQKACSRFPGIPQDWESELRGGCPSCGKLVLAVEFVAPTAPPELCGECGHDKHDEKCPSIKNGVQLRTWCQCPSYRPASEPEAKACEDRHPWVGALLLSHVEPPTQIPDAPKDLREAAREFVDELFTSGNGKAKHLRLFTDFPENDGQYLGGYSEKVVVDKVEQFATEQLSTAKAKWLEDFIAEVEKVCPIKNIREAMRSVAERHFAKTETEKS